MNWLWHWLRGKLGVDIVDADVIAMMNQLGQARQQLATLQVWVKNIDRVLWDLEQRMLNGAPPENSRTLAASIRNEMMAAKLAFPTHMENLK